MLEDFLKSLEKQRKQERVGSVSLSIVKEMDETNRDLDRLHEELEVAVQVAVDKLHEDHLPECERLTAKNNEIWERIHNELGVPAEDTKYAYKVNMETGEVVRELREDETDGVCPD